MAYNNFRTLKCWDGGGGHGFYFNNIFIQILVDVLYLAMRFQYSILSKLVRIVSYELSLSQMLLERGEGSLTRNELNYFFLY